MKLFKVEDDAGCKSKLQPVEVRAYFADGTSRVVDFGDSKSVARLELDLNEHVVSEVRIIPKSKG